MGSRTVFLSRLFLQAVIREKVKKGIRS
jgi:hypothetical protein